MKVIRNPEFKAPVKVTVPTPDGPRDEQFTGRFRALTVTEIAIYDFRSAESTTAFLEHVFLGWDTDLRDDDGSPFEVSPQNIALLIDQPYTRTALTKSYFDSVSGLPAARRGN